MRWRWLLLLLLTLSPTLSEAAPALSEGDWRNLKAWARSYGVTVFPASPFVGQMVVITDDPTSSACTSSGGAALSLCAWDGSAWISVGGGGGAIGTGTALPATCTPGGTNALFLDTNAQELFACTFTNTFTSTTADNVGWPSNSTLKSITWANSLANAQRTGDGVTPMCHFTDVTRGPTIRPCTDSNERKEISSGFNWGLYSRQFSADMLVVTPGNTGNARYTWTNTYGPLKTISFPADALYVRGASTLVTDVALVSGGLVSPYVTITDSDNDGFYRYHVMDPDWNGGTVTTTITVVNTNATPANAFRVDFSGQCYPAGALIGTTISTTGEQSAIVSFGASGSCGGSACNQNDPASATTIATTLNGTPAGGNLCGFQWQVHATGTTETVAGIKVIDATVQYEKVRGF